jgi:hypothetical protein
MAVPGCIAVTTPILKRRIVQSLIYSRPSSRGTNLALRKGQDWPLFASEYKRHFYYGYMLDGQDSNEGL